jgi:hypothetical protein
VTSPDQPGDGEAPDTERLPTSGVAESSRTSAERAQAIAVLDEPLDDKDLGEQIRRPGMSRSTKLLLGLLAAVVLVAVGLFVGRATAPDTGPGSSPDVVGTVESVGAGGNPLTVRVADGSLAVLSTTPGTSVGTARSGGVAALQPGQRVTVGAEVNKVGSLDATNVLVTP